MTRFNFGSLTPSQASTAIGTTAPITSTATFTFKTNSTQSGTFPSMVSKVHAPLSGTTASTAEFCFGSATSTTSAPKTFSFGSSTVAQPSPAAGTHASTTSPAAFCFGSATTVKPASATKSALASNYYEMAMAAINMNSSNDVIKALFKEALTSSISEGSKVLLKATIQKKDDTFILQAVEELSMEVRHELLQILLTDVANFHRLVTAIVSRFPAVTQRKYADGNLALHLAITMQSSESAGPNISDEILLAILLANKDAAKAKDMNGVLPLQLAIECKLSDEVVLAILEANEDAANNICNNDQSMLLHKAIELPSSDQVILALLNANLDAANTMDKKGLLPLQKAIESNLSKHIILTLLEANQDAAKATNEQGMLPLQKAIESNLSEEVILALLKANEDLTSRKNIEEAGFSFGFNNSIKNHKFAMVMNAVKVNYSNEVLKALIRVVFNQQSSSCTKDLIKIIIQEKGDNFILQVAEESSDYIRSNLLHVILSNNNTSDFNSLIISLILKFPAIATMQYADGNLALHLALSSLLSKSVRSNHFEEVFLALLASNKDAAKLSDKNGELPLQRAIELNLSDKIVLAILDANEDAAKTIRFNDKSSVLHNAIECKYSDNVILAILNANKDAAKTPATTTGILPLQVAMNSRLSDEVILAILAANEDAAMSTIGYNSNLPLQRAIEYKYSDNVILALIKANEAAAKKASTSTGKLPLQMAMQCKLSDDIVLAILAANEEAARSMSCDGSLPLHCAITDKCSDNVIIALLNANKDAAKTITRDNRLPLKMAITCNLSDEVVLAILAANEDAAKIMNYGDSKLPLHMAIEYKYSDNVILALLMANKDAAKVVNGVVPLQKAIDSKVYSSAVIKALFVEAINSHTFGCTRDLLEAVIQQQGDVFFLQIAEELSDKVRKELLQLILVETTEFDDLVMLMVSKFPAVTRLKYENGNLALHVAIWKKCSEKVLLSVLAANKGAAMIESASGELPLYMAIQSCTADAVFMQIFSAYPCAAMIRCKQSGMLPLHLAATTSASPLQIEILIKEYPEALDIISNNATPRDLVTSALPEESIKMICRPNLYWKHLNSCYPSINDDNNRENCNNTSHIDADVATIKATLELVNKNLDILNQKLFLSHIPLVKAPVISSTRPLKTAGVIDQPLSQEDGRHAQSSIGVPVRAIQNDEVNSGCSKSSSLPLVVPAHKNHSLNKMNLLETVSAYDLHEMQGNSDAIPSDETELIQDKLKHLKNCGKIQGIGTLECSSLHNEMLDRQEDDIQFNSFVLIGENVGGCTKIPMPLRKENYCQACENDAFVDSIPSCSVDDSSDRFSSTSLPEYRCDSEKIIYQEVDNLMEFCFSASCDNETDTITS